MAKYPKIKFKISKKQELETFLAFLDEANYTGNDRNLNWAFYNPHPELRVIKQKNISRKDKIKIISKFINQRYKENSNKIRSQIPKIQKDWKKVEKKFFGLTDKIFNNYSWPKGKYIAYFTIWGMYPRFLDNKTFQIPYEHKNKKYIPIVIAHEMLHFIFYDYLYKNFPKFKKQEYNLKLWNLSEAFNVIIQNSSDWIKVFKEETKSYPEHKKLISDLRKKWKKSNRKINTFLEYSL